MKITNDGRTLVAEDGFAIMCKCHNMILGTEVYLECIMKDRKLVMDSQDNYTEVKINEIIWKN